MKTLKEKLRNLSGKQIAIGIGTSLLMGIEAYAITRYNVDSLGGGIALSFTYLQGKEYFDCAKPKLTS